MRIVQSFVMKEVFKCMLERQYDEMKNGQKLKLGDAQASPQEISKKYKRQSLGMPKAYPIFIITI